MRDLEVEVVITWFAAIFVIFFQLSGKNFPDMYLPLTLLSRKWQVQMKFKDVSGKIIYNSND